MLPSFPYRNANARHENREVNNRRQGEKMPQQDAAPIFFNLPDCEKDEGKRRERIAERDQS